MLPVCRSHRGSDEIESRTGKLAGPMVPSGARRLLQALAGAVFPPQCLSCGRLFRQERFHAVAHGPASVDFPGCMALYFCPTCRYDWRPVASPLCRRCGVVFESRAGDDHLCGRCLERAGHYTMARAAGIYAGSLKIAIHQLKFKAATHLARPLGGWLEGVCREYWAPGEIDLIAPVPLHRRRFRRRGFNQAFLLVRHWQPPPGCEIDRELLVRTRPTVPQRGLTREQRRRNIKNAFAVRRRGGSAGRHVLLVDDVFTTGSTAEACARALIRDGARRVDVLTLARAL